ncbi:DNA mismatch repair protein MutT [Psychromonas marina]|uniref:DNA mismatch repair protein MutT n=1 Tax=Psychromonas marina TaxID=88364 RepID=A0ABQ6E1Y5_9GAMM|nr:NUDIX domain-containing protein [Psychromonas marina]GLS91421.1 DNA mismatch repair protein MutT [Psychromonas marina]
MSNKEIDKLAWLYIKDGKLLSTRSKNKQLFYLPGGKRESGESDQQALVREIKEEVSVDLLPDSIRYAGTFKAQADGKSSDTIVKLTCYFAQFEGVLCADAEIEEIDFIEYSQRARCSVGSIYVMDWLQQQNLIT